MNAVEAAEDLLKIGRQLQAMERMLCLSPTVAGSPPGWHVLFVDPAVRLEGLLARHSATQPTVREASQQPPPTPVDWPMAPVRTAPSNDMPRRAGLPLRQPESTVPTVGTNLSEPGAAPSGQGIQLARGYTDLQAIVNANLHATSRPQPAVVNQGGDRYTSSQSSAGSRTGLAVQQPGNGSYRTQATPQSTPRDMGNAGAYSRQAPEARPAQQRIAASATGTSLRSQEPGAFAGDQVPGLETAPGVTSTSTPGFATDTVKQEASAHWIHGASLSPGDANTVQFSVDGSEQWSGADIAAAAQTANEEAPPWPDVSFHAGLLHPVQVEQILDAFNERLELLLLRAYGP